MKLKDHVKPFIQCQGIVLVALILLISTAMADAQSSGLIPGASTLGQMEPINTTGSCLRMIGALCLCLGVFAGGVQLYKSRGGVSRLGSKRRLMIREKLPLSAKSSIFLVSLDGREFLVSSGPDQIQFIPSPKGTELDFGESLQDACGNGEVFDV